MVGCSPFHFSLWFWHHMTFVKSFNDREGMLKAVLVSHYSGYPNNSLERDSAINRLRIFSANCCPQQGAKGHLAYSILFSSLGCQQILKAILCPNWCVIFWIRVTSYIQTPMRTSFQCTKNGRFCHADCARRSISDYHATGVHAGKALSEIEANTVRIGTDSSWIWSTRVKKDERKERDK